jgi:hypothetical protein
MKIGWLVWEDEGDKFPILVPDGHEKLGWAYRKVQIAYAEIVETE